MYHLVHPTLLRIAFSKIIKGWNVPFLNSIFNTQIVNYITNTPMYRDVTEDRILWKNEDKWEYTLMYAGAAITSRFKENGDLIWSLKMIPKVKNLIWRACRNCLPTRMRVQDKCVNCPSLWLEFGRQLSYFLQMS